MAETESADRTAIDRKMAPLRDVNRQVAQSGRRVPWAYRKEIIQRQFPSTVDARRWVRTLDDDTFIEVFGRILYSAIQAVQAEPGKDGPRYAVEYEEGYELYRKMMGLDYSTLPFAETFRVLSRGMSLTTLHRKTGLSRSKVYRLLHGDDPSAEEMEIIAKAFRKHPSYFHEYRVGAVIGELHQRVAEAPERSIALWRRIQEA